MEEGDSENKSSHNDTVHLTRDQRVGEDDEDENNLNDGHLGHDETLLNGLDLLSGLGGILFHSLAVTWHFYYLSRK